MTPDTNETLIEPAEISRSAILKIVDASLTLALATGVFYVCGYTYHEGYFGVLNVPMRALALSPQDILVFGSLPTFLLLVSVGLILMGRELVRVNAARLAKNRWVGWLVPNSPLAWSDYWTGVFLLFSAFLLFGLIEWSTEQGRQAARRFLEGACPLANVAYTASPDQKPLQVSGCFVVSSAELMWFKRVTSAGTLEKSAVGIPLSAIVRIEIRGALSEFRSSIGHRVPPASSPAKTPSGKDKQD